MSYVQALLTGCITICAVFFVLSVLLTFDQSCYVKLSIIGIYIRRFVSIVGVKTF